MSLMLQIVNLWLRPNGEGLNDSFIKKLKEFDYKFIAPFDAVRVYGSWGDCGAPMG